MYHWNPTMNKMETKIKPIDDFKPEKIPDHSITQAITDFGNNTTIHGLTYVINGAGIIFRLFWTLATVAFFCIFLVQGISIINDYRTYPYTTKIDIITKSSLTFPAVTVCNSNSMRRSKLVGTRFEGLIAIDGGVSGADYDYSWWFSSNFFGQYGSSPDSHQSPQSSTSDTESPSQSSEQSPVSPNSDTESPSQSSPESPMSSSLDTESLHQSSAQSPKTSRSNSNTESPSQSSAQSPMSPNSDTESHQSSVQSPTSPNSDTDSQSQSSSNSNSESQSYSSAQSPTSANSDMESPTQSLTQTPSFKSDTDSPSPSSTQSPSPSTSDEELSEKSSQSSTSDTSSSQSSSQSLPDRKKRAIGLGREKVRLANLAKMQASPPRRVKRGSGMPSSSAQAPSSSPEWPPPSSSPDQPFDEFSWYDPTLTDDFYYYDHGWDGVTGETDWEGFYQNARADDFSDLIDVVSPTREELVDYGHQLKDFVLQCSFDRRPCNISRDFHVWQNRYYGNCFTFNANWSTVVNSTIRSTGKTGALNGLHLTLFVEQPEYVGILTHQTGAKVSIHDPSVRPFPEDDAFEASTGFTTSVSIRQEYITRLDGNYGNCTRNGANTNFTSTEFKYSYTACLKTCYQLHLVDYCGCVTDVVFLNHDVKCSILNETQQWCVQYVESLNSDNKLTCHCPTPCEERKYVKSVATALWPSERYEEHLYHRVSSENEQAARILQNVELSRKNLIRLKIYYEELNYEVIQQDPVYTPEGLLGSVGGLMGLYIGMSALSLCEVIVFILKVSKLVARKLCFRNHVHPVKT